MSTIKNTDWADKRWIQQPIEQHESHWNSPHPNTKPRRFLFAALVMMAVFLFFFGNQLAHADAIEKPQQHSQHHKDFSGFENDPCKYDKEIWWPGHICTEPAYYDPRHQQHYVGPIINNNPGTVPEPGTTLTIGFGLIAMAIKFKPRVKGMRMAQCSKTHKIAAGDL